MSDMPKRMCRCVVDEAHSVLSSTTAGRAFASITQLERSILENAGDFKASLLWIYMPESLSTAPHVQAEAPASPERDAFPPRGRPGSATPRPGTVCVRGGQRSSRSIARPARRTGRGGTGSCRDCCFRLARARACEREDVSRENLDGNSKSEAAKGTELFQSRPKDPADVMDPRGSP